MRLIPGRVRRKQLLLVAALILAGCGGSHQGNPPAEQVVTGHGFHFSAPAGWQVQRGPGRVGATHDSELVQVATFPLVHPYAPALFGKVARELAVRMRSVARETGGKVTDASTVTVDGVRAHSYRVAAGDHVDRYTFVLRDKREHQLLCRRVSGGSESACDLLLRSFRVA